MVEERRGRTRRRISESVHLLWERLSSRSERSHARPQDEAGSESTSSESRPERATRSGSHNLGETDCRCNTPVCERAYFGPLISDDDVGPPARPGFASLPPSPPPPPRPMQPPETRQRDASPPQGPRRALHLAAD